MKAEKIISTLAKFAILLFVFFAGQYVRMQMTPTVDKALPSQTSEENEVSIMFDYGNDTFDVVRSVPFKEGESVFDAVLSATSTADIEIEYADYGKELGALVESLGGFEGGEAWWQYWVNNEYKNVGMSNTALSKGDTVLLKLTAHNPKK